MCSVSVLLGSHWPSPSANLSSPSVAGPLVAHLSKLPTYAFLAAGSGYYRSEQLSTQDVGTDKLNRAIVTSQCHE